MAPYQPFVADPKHLGDLDGQRFVVLRMPPVVNDMWRQVRETICQRLSATPVSYPARAHITLCGFAAGTSLEAVQDVVRAWARSTPSLLIEPECVSLFPAPFQIVIVQVRKQPELFAALATLRRQAGERGLRISTVVSPDQWIFHMSVAYCSALDASIWQELTSIIATMTLPSVSCIVDVAEVAAFDEGREYWAEFSR